VKAIGVELKNRKLAQVSTNLTDFEQTSLRRVFEAVRLEAGRNGCSIYSSEIVGLVPRRAISIEDEAALQLEDFSPERKILENRLETVINAEMPRRISLPGI
jgi:glutamate formiminotransferase